MAFTDDTEALLLAYAYDELPAPDALLFEQRMNADAALRAEVEGIRASRALFGRDAPGSATRPGRAGPTYRP